MKLIIALLFSSMAFAQVGTGNIKQSDVRTEMATSPNSLTGMVSRANSTGGWHSSYSGSKDRLSNFKGYNDGGGYNSFSAARSTASAAGACGNTPTTYWGDGTTLNGSTYLYRTSTGTYAYSGWYSDGSVWKYWNGSSFTSNGLCSF